MRATIVLVLALIGSAMPMPVQNFGMGEGGLKQLIQALMMQQASAQPVRKQGMELPLWNQPDPRDVELQRRLQELARRDQEKRAQAEMMARAYGDTRTDENGIGTDLYPDRNYMAARGPQGRPLPR